jgi:glycosyltransferase involved in cell wall biosynthesis
MSFMVTGFLAGLIQRRPDVIVGTSPQFFTVCAAWVLSVFRRRPFVFELRDLWPASIKVVGAMREGRLLSALEGLELFLYRRAAAIVTVTETFKRELIARGIDGGKIHVVINGVDPARYSPRPKDAELTRELGLEGKLVVAYMGTHGMAHALHRVLEAAGLLRAREDIAFLFVGSGAQREALAAQGREMGLPNVRFVSRQPKAAMPRYWSLGDVSLVHLKDDPLFGSVIPSKVFEAMGMGLPILLAQPDGEAGEIVRSTGAGLVVPPERPSELAAAVERLADDVSYRASLAAASAAAAASYSRDRQAERMLGVLQSLVARSV